MELPGGIPSHDTFGDVFARLDPEQFQHCFVAWVQAVAEVTQGEVVAIDGKRCGALMTAPWASRPSTWLTCGPRPTAWCWARPRWQKSPMRSPPYPSCCNCSNWPVASSPSMGCQKEIAQQIIEAQADYLLAVKKNQGRLYEDVCDLFEGPRHSTSTVPHDARTVNKNHGRLETRQCWVISGPRLSVYIQTRQQWKLNAVVKVTARREIATETSVQPRYYISSWPGRPRHCFLEHGVARCHLPRRPQPSP